jgi:hypothetical protein
MRQVSSGQNAAMRIDEVDWAGIRACYGPAVEVPGMLAALHSLNPEERNEAIGELWGCLCHQGTVYEASAQSVPFLFEAARTAPLAGVERIQLLGLIVHIGIGEDSCWDGYTSWAEVEQCAKASASVLPALLAWATEGAAEARTWGLALAAYNPSVWAEQGLDPETLLAGSSPEIAHLYRLSITGGDPDQSAIRDLVDGIPDRREYYDEVISELPMNRQVRRIILEIADTELL